MLDVWLRSKYAASFFLKKITFHLQYAWCNMITNANEEIKIIGVTKKLSHKILSQVISR